MTLDAIELLVTGERVTLPVAVPLPVRRGSIDVGISTARGGPWVHPTLHRTLTVDDGTAAPLVLFARDLRALFPRGGRVWLVVRYAGQLLATAPVTLVVG